VRGGSVEQFFKLYHHVFEAVHHAVVGGHLPATIRDQTVIGDGWIRR